MTVVLAVCLALTMQRASDYLFSVENTGVGVLASCLGSVLAIGIAYFVMGLR